jgi:hypothetical protein
MTVSPSRYIHPGVTERGAQGGEGGALSNVDAAFISTGINDVAAPVQHLLDRVLPVIAIQPPRSVARDATTYDLFGDTYYDRAKAGRAILSTVGDAPQITVAQAMHPPSLWATRAQVFARVNAYAQSTSWAALDATLEASIREDTTTTTAGVPTAIGLGSWQEGSDSPTRDYSAPWYAQAVRAGGPFCLATSDLSGGFTTQSALAALSRFAFGSSTRSGPVNASPVTTLAVRRECAATLTAGATAPPDDSTPVMLHAPVACLYTAPSR